MKRMEERDMKGKDLRQLYRKFNDEMERVELPSGDELRQLIGERGAEKKPSAPYIPLSRPKPVLRYAMAAMLVLALGVGVWMVERNRGGFPVVAERPVEPLPDETAATVADSAIHQVPVAPQPEGEVLASARAEDEKVLPAVVADSAAVPMPVPADVEAPLLAVEDTAGEEIPVAESKDTLDEPAPLPHIIDNYPDKPTVEEVEKAVRSENDRRALRSNRKRHSNRKKEGFIEKQRKEREGLYYEIKTVPMPTQHFTPGSNGAPIIRYY